MLTKVQADAEAVAHPEYVCRSENVEGRWLTWNTIKVRAGFKSMLTHVDDCLMSYTAADIHPKQSAESEPSTPARSSQYSRPPTRHLSKHSVSHEHSDGAVRAEWLTFDAQIHAGNMQRKVWRHRLELPRSDGPTPVPPRLDEHPLW